MLLVLLAVVIISVAWAENETDGWSPGYPDFSDDIDPGQRRGSR